MEYIRVKNDYIVEVFPFNPFKVFTNKEFLKDCYKVNTNVHIDHWDKYIDGKIIKLDFIDLEDKKLLDGGKGEVIKQNENDQGNIGNSI